jgi:hypothetical protein
MAYWVDFSRCSFLRPCPEIVDNLAVIADILLLGLAFCVLYTLARLSRRRFLSEASKCAFVLVLVIPLNVLRKQVPAFRNLLGLANQTELTIAFAITLAIPAYVAVRWGRRVIPALASLVLVLFPFTFFTFGRVFTRWYAEKSEVWSPTALKSSLPSAPSPSHRRLLWMIFDEMDERLTFIDRPAGLKLPEIDRLREESLWAANAFPPGPGTSISMPSLITGRVITRKQPENKRELMLMLEGGEDAKHGKDVPNLFARARALGYRTALVGWYLPYCKEMGSNLDFCRSFPLRYRDSDLPFFSLMVKRMDMVLSSVPFLDQIPYLRSLSLSQVRGVARVDIKTYEAFLQAAIPVAINQDFDLILLHWPIPHRPGIYSRSRDDFDASGRGTYVDNLALVDRTLRELRQALEKAGVWDSTTILLSADHWDRFSRQVDGKIGHRIPFLLKLAGQTTRLDYLRRFDTVATHDLILSILSGELQDPESVARWLDQRNDPNPFAALDPASPPPA